MYTHAGANAQYGALGSSPVFYWLGLNEGYPGWPYLPNGPQNPANPMPGPYYGGPLSWASVAAYTWSNQAPQRIVPATNDWTVQKPRLVSVLGTPVPLTLSPMSGQPQYVYEGFGPVPTCFQIVPNGDIVQSSISAVPSLAAWIDGGPANGPFDYGWYSYFLSNGNFNWHASVTYGNYQPPITQVQTSGGKTFYVM